MNRILSLLVLFGLPLYLQGQSDSTIVLEEVEIENQHLKDHARGEHIEELSATIIQNNEGSTLSDLLSQQAGINIRPYGLAGLATASIRGTGSNHTAVYWEGLNLQSITTGGADLSQIPVTFIDQVALQYGSGTAYGSGAMGGAIHIQQNRIAFENKPLTIEHTMKYGSFASFYQGLNIKHTTNKTYLTSKLFYQQAANNYTYSSAEGKSMTMTNAATEKYGFLLEGGYKLSEYEKIHIKYWAQKNYLETPESEDTSIDQIHRGLIKYERVGNQTYLKAKVALLSNQLDFDSHATQSTISARSFITELTADTQLYPSWKLEATLNHNFEWAITKNYGAGNTNRNRTALTMINTWDIFNFLSLDLVMRQLVVDQSLAPFTPSLSMKTILPFNFVLRGKAAKSYRIPTFNDFFWKGLGDRGNPDLIPEEGISFDLGLEQTFKIGQNTTIKNSATAFYTNITNWIRWAPDSLGWTPENIAELWTYGLELRGKYSYQNDQIQISLSPTYNLVFAQTNKEVSDRIISSIDEQTTYTPKHQGGGHLAVSLKKLQFTYSHSYTGLQFTDEENTTRWSLAPYQIADAGVKYKLSTDSIKSISIRVEIKNIFNENYQARRAYPMPGRNYNITINFKINN